MRRSLLIYVALVVVAVALGALAGRPQAMAGPPLPARSTVALGPEMPCPPPYDQLCPP